MRFGIFLITLLLSLPVQASLSPSEKSTLRFHLENLRNEVELLVRNNRSNEQDVRRQEREFALFQVFKRIPFEARTKELEKELRASARKEGVKISTIEIRRNSAAPPQLPSEVFTDTKRLRITDDQLVETLYIRIQGKGPLETAEGWTYSWPKSLVRWVEPQGIFAAGQTRPDAWEIRARTYRFRKFQYPKLRPRNPLTMLPESARRNPQDFARSEPELWSLVTQIREWTGKSAKPYENRRTFLLNDERMSFFLKKTEIARR